MDNQVNGINLTEEQLQRTYKGVIFTNVDEKNRVAAIDEQTAAYCENLTAESYDSLMKKREELSSLPQTIFMSYNVKIMAEIGIKEKNEAEEYKVKLENASLEEIDNIKAEIDAKKYSQPIVSEMYSVFLQCKRAAQNKVMESELNGYETLTRGELKELRNKISEKPFEKDIIDNYINKINVQYDVVEQNELEALCSNLENMEIKELEGALRIIDLGEYQQKYSAKYVTMINSSLEVLHDRNLGEYCKEVENVFDREKLGEVKRLVDEEACDAKIKVKYYERISKQVEIIDYRDLEALTIDMDSKNESELKSLYQQIEDGNYNKKFVKKFLKDIRVCMEKKQYNNALNTVSGIYDAGREGVADSECKLDALGYRAGVVKVAKNMLEDRKMQLDMEEVIEICNDFDSLSDSEVMALEEQIENKNLMERCKAVYLDKLSQRRFNIALTAAGKAAAYFVQLANKYGISGGDIIIASRADEFINAYKSFRSTYLTGNSMDVPAFIMKNTLNLAISYKNCYVYASGKPFVYPNDNIKCFKTVKKLLFENLAIELKDGTTISLGGSINKKVLPAFVGCMNEMLLNINNTGFIDSFATQEYKVVPLNKELYSCTDKKYLLNKEELQQISIGKIWSVQINPELVKAVHCPVNRDWNEYKVKVISNYQMPQTEPLLFVYDKTLLNSAKEGIAISDNNIYIKRSGKSAEIIPIDRIFEIKCLNKIYIETIDNTQLQMDIIAASEGCMQDLAQCFNEFVKNMQLYNALV